MLNGKLNATTASIAQGFFRWAVLVLFLCGIPVFMVSIAVYKYYSVFEDERITRLKTDLPIIASEVEAQVSQEDFMARLFFDACSKLKAENAPAEAAIEQLEKLKQQFAGELEYIVWNRSGKELAKTFKDNFSSVDWQNVFTVADGVFKQGEDYVCPKDLLEKAKIILGRQFSAKLLLPDKIINKPILTWADSASKIPPFGCYDAGASIALVFFDAEKLKKNSAVWHKLLAVSERHKDLRLGLYSALNANEPLYKAFKQSSDAELKKALSLCEKDNLRFLELKNDYLAFKHLTENLRIFALLPRAKSRGKIVLSAGLGGLLCLILMLPFNMYLIKTIILKQPVAVSIKTKLIFLFVLACGIPIMATAMILHEYGLQKRHLMMKSAHKTCEAFLEGFDKGCVSFFNEISEKLSNYFSNWYEKGAAEVSHEKAEATIKLLDKIGSPIYSVISPSGEAGSGIFPAGHMYFLGGLDNTKINFDKSLFLRKRSKEVENNVLTSYLICRMLVANFNSEELSETSASKLELMSESLVNQSVTEFTNAVLNNLGTIKKWKLKTVGSTDYSYMKFLHGDDQSKIEHLVSVFWPVDELQQPYAEHAIPDANRNSSEIKIFCRSEKTGFELPTIEEDETELKNFVRRKSGEKSGAIEIVKYKGEDYIGTSATGKNLYSCKIICLYPLKVIDNEISGQQSELVSVMLFCLLFSIGLANLLAQAFLIPMQKLLNGALAIERRDVSHRVDYKANDEFGQAASTFNDVMVRLEELRAAQIVQEGLFPRPSFKKGRFEIYGKSVAMSELGGDYFDYFETDKKHFAVLLGDVSGHGIGAAVIMAMAKAAILASANLQTKPAELLASLHKMVLGAKGKRQKKIMTFQYMYINSETADTVYSSAGACSLMLVRSHGQRVEEVAMKSSVLGGFKKAGFYDIKLSLNEFDTVVFYTDGIIEAKNRYGREIGYDGFKEMLLKNYSSNPKAFYKNVYEDYKKHTFKVGAQDDLTMIFMTCLPAC